MPLDLLCVLVFADVNKDRIGQITALLQEWGDGNNDAKNELWLLVYEKLRSMAHRYLHQERRGHTLQPTDLVHEVYMRLSDKDRMQWNDRNHFFAMSARMMRWILVDHARHQATAKHGGCEATLSLDEADGVTIGCGSELVAVNDALTSLESIDSSRASIVELRFFGGFTNREVAALLECSERTVQRQWQVAKLWLYQELKGARVEFG